MDVIIITGPPFSGKGTQCAVLERHFGFKHISTGDRCRQEKSNNTDLGKIMSAYEEKGNLVPDEIMKTLFSRILDENVTQSGIILDGYPRTIPQVNDLIELLTSKGLAIDKVINIEVPTQELLLRAKTRAQSSTRVDDKNPEIHLKRIEIFEKTTSPAIDFLKTKTTVFTFDGLGSIEEISKRILSSLEK